MASEREQVQTRDRYVERSIDPYYEDLMKELRENNVRSVEGRIVIRGDEEPWVQNRNAYVQYLLHPFWTDAAYAHMMVFINNIQTHNGMHRHQGGLVLYVLEGKGRTVYDGHSADWEEGDLILLPIRPGGVAHQHYNDDPGKPAKWLAFIPWGFFRDHLQSEIVQVADSPDWKGATKAAVISVAEQRARDDSGVVSGPVNDGTLLDKLFTMRDSYRELAETAESLVVGTSLPWEINRQGETKWYMHPGKDDTSLRSLIVYRQRIPGGSRSGRQLHPGGIAHYIMRGTGHTILDGQRYDWKAGDLIALPVRAQGIDYQHFNDDPKNPVEFIAATPNLVEILGVDLGGRFEQVENAPEYTPPT